MAAYRQMADSEAAAWNVQGSAAARAALGPLCEAALADLAVSPNAARAVLRDARALHARITGPLVPPGVEGIAGVWRGTPGSEIERVEHAVFNPRAQPGLRRRDACLPADQVGAAMAALGVSATDAWDAGPQGGQTDFATLATFAQRFFAAHPFVDGNGHVARVLLQVLGARLGLAPQPGWRLHPRPWDHHFSVCVQWHDRFPDLLACHMRRWFG